MAVNKWFLSLYIPLAALIFASIPPAVLICELVVMEEGIGGLTEIGTTQGMDKLQAIASRYWEYFTDSVSFEEKEGTVPTQQGCTCKFPFSYSGRDQHNCSNVGPAVLDSEGKPSLWCDTGPFCGRKYHAADKVHTSKPCCYDLCVDSKGKTIRPDSSWHMESKRIVHKKILAKEQKRQARKNKSQKSTVPQHKTQTTQGKFKGRVRTAQGCTCKLPFEFGGETFTNCTDFGAAVLDPHGRPALWCDTGPNCGTPYHSSDRRFTDRTCCYDACVDTKGKTVRPNSQWHQESKAGVN